MIWFILITLVWPNGQAARIKVGAYKTQAACEQVLKTSAVQTTDAKVKLIGYCTNAAELKKSDAVNGVRSKK
jgi:hypothetical protein